jgi:FkbM family methyltransferase
MPDQNRGDGQLEELRDRVAAFGASELDAAAIEPLLRADRRALAETLFAGQAGLSERHRLIAHSGLADLRRDHDDEALAGRLRESLGDLAAPAPGALLGAMLMLRAFELPLPRSLDVVPEWLRSGYVRYLLTGPRLFHARGDAACYEKFLAGAVELLRAYLLRRPPAPLCERLGDLFVDESNFTQSYFNEQFLRELGRNRAQILEAWLIAKGVALAHVFPPRAAVAGRRLRVGVLAQHLEKHTETFFTLAHIERLPREHCTLTLYTLHAPTGPIARHAAGLADAVVVLTENDVRSAVARVRADELDFLLIGSNITTVASPIALMACCRLARVQAVSASSPVTTGMTNADWFLSAELNDTEEAAREGYTEQVWRMPGMLTRYAYYLDTDAATLSASREEFGLTPEDLVFFSASNFFKTTPDLSATWARILAEVPGAWLLLMPFNPYWSRSYLAEPFRARVLEQVEQAGGDPSRVLVLDPVPTRADLHSIMALVDVYLDSHPFAGACSLLDPLLCGLPLVARTGRTFRAGVAAGMLRGLGLGDLALDDEDSYRARAVALARDPALRKRTSERVRAAISPKNPVFDSETGSRNLEAAVRSIVGRYDAEETALLCRPTDKLRSLIVRLAGELAAAGSPAFQALTDLELVRLLVVPYFQALGEPGHMLDVGACAGEMAEPLLALGWSADLFEPDPACRRWLDEVSARHPSAAVHALAIGERDQAEVAFYQSAPGLSGLAPSPYGAAAATLSVPAARLDSFARKRGLKRTDLLKVDVEGWDFDALLSHDFAALPPRLALIEFGTWFARQTRAAVAAGIAAMAARGYDALILSYEDDGNFARQVWRYRLIAMSFEAPTARNDGQAGGNIVFFRRGDTMFLATVARLLLGLLPPRERARRAHEWA